MNLTPPAFTRKRRNPLRNADGAIDLASIMVGTVVIGVTASAVAATVFAAVPWAQNAAAEQTLQSISTAQAVAQVKEGAYLTVPELVAKDYLPKGAELLGKPSLPAGGQGFTVKAPQEGEAAKLAINVGADANCYAAVLRSDSGDFFWLDNTMVSAEPLSAEAASACADMGKLGTEVGAPAPVTMVFTVDNGKYAGAKAYTLPIANIDGSIIVNWGDGTAPETISADYAKHTYTAAKTHEISISGAFGKFGNFGTTYDTELITKVSVWTDGAKTSDLGYAFNDSLITELSSIPAGVTKMNNMFAGAKAFNKSLGDKFDTSQVKTMSEMFYGANAFNSSLGSNFDTRNVENMFGMFRDAKLFNQELGAKFDTSKVQNMGSMFFGATAFNKPLGDKFDTSEVTAMGSMFSGALLFDQSLGLLFNTSKVESMDNMFASARQFNRNLGSGFDTAKVKNFYGMFNSAWKFNQPLGDKFVITDQALSLDNMFYTAKVFSQDLSGWNVEAFPTAPTNFSSGSSLTAGQLPKWGQSLTP